MSVPSRIASVARNLFRRARVERELSDELRVYVESLTDERIRRGEAPEVARRRALLDVGGVEQVKEKVRDIRAGAIVDVVLRDLRFAMRALIKTPAFTVAAALALALGIGATTAILSVVNAVLLRPLPYADSDRLVVMLHQGHNPVAPENFLDWRQQMRSFTDVAAAEYWTPNLTAVDEPEHINGLRLTAGMLPMLGVSPLLGRVFTLDEDQPGNEHVAVIGYGLWQRRFAGDHNVIGRQIQLEGQQFTIIGVMPASFHFAPFWATRAELWAPLALGPRGARKGGNSLRVFARLRPGVTFAQARADVGAVTARLERESPGTNRGVTVESLKDKVVGNIQTPLLVLLVAVAFVLLIACANVAHMLLARATARQKELAVRAALGATRGRLAAQMLTESAMLAALGGLGGLLLALWGVKALVAASPAIIPRIANVTIDGRVLAMTILITAGTAIVFGLIPALRAARVDLAETFKDGDRGSSDGHGRHRLRSTLVASEFALALVLLVGAGLMLRSFTALQRIDPGFDSRGVVTMTVSVSGSKEGDPALRQGFFTDALARVRAIPGLESVSLINHLPIAGDQWGFPFTVEGRPKPKPGDAPSATYRVVFPGYFRTMRIPMLRGRDVTDADRDGAPKVVVINEFMARQHWPGEDAIGRRITLGDTSLLTIVGITKNAVREQWSAPAEEEVFVPFAQVRAFHDDPGSHYGYLTLVARAACRLRDRCDPTAFAAPIVAAVHGIDRNVPISAVQTMDAVVNQATAESRFYVVLLAAFAIIAVVLAAVGIYGVMSYSVSRRTHEIGIRIALGAEPSSVLGFVVGQGMRLALAGAAVGLVAAFGLTRLMRGLLFGVGATDPVTFAAVTVTLCAVALAASFLPARRATRIDPLVALRAD
ncbi:MAG TPA: ABC transporter permease [Gemmatimonadaceae bacterium]|nr:ABC transporter permease [Gemmatimonadaceae bacterium]